MRQLRRYRSRPVRHTLIRAIVPVLAVLVMLGAAVAISQSSPASADPPLRCSDGVDNDGDGKTDYPEDPGCTSPSDRNESDETDPDDPPDPPAQCADGADNDGDTRTDYPDDPGCASTADPDETDPPPPDSPSIVTTDEAAAPPAAAEVRLLSPFPVVRIRGRVTSRGTRIDLLTVRAPRGSRVSVRCHRGGCPRGREVRTSRGRTIRFRRFERRLRPGALVRVFVTKPGRIGKYTRFTVRRRKSPLRRDACTLPGVERLARCPSS
jgi:hypothetical protein